MGGCKQDNLAETEWKWASVFTARLMRENGEQVMGPERSGLIRNNRENGENSRKQNVHEDLAEVVSLNRTRFRFCVLSEQSF